MDIAELDALPRGTEVYVRVSLDAKDRETGWYTAKLPNRPGALSRPVNHLDIECVAPARQIVAGDRVMRQNLSLPRVVLFVHGDAAMLKVEITDHVEVAPLSQLSHAA